MVEQKIILATNSPYRKIAFEELDFDFITDGSGIDEKFEGRPKNPKQLVKYLAKLKAEAVAKKHKNGIVIGFDSLAYFNGEILEKPSSEKDAYKRLKKLSNNKHNFYTGIHLIDIRKHRAISKIVNTTVYFRKLSDLEISKYLKQHDDYTKYSTGYDTAHHYSATFTIKIVGSYNNFRWGFPMENIILMLKEIGYKIK